MTVMPNWLHEIMVIAGGGVTIAVCLAVPKVWVNSIINRKDIDRHDDKFSGIFERLDTMSNDVSFIRGKLDHE